MRRRLVGLLLAIPLVAGCDLAALGTGATDCGGLDAVECREALFLAAKSVGPAPGDIVADFACPPTPDCPSIVDWVVVYLYPDDRALAVRSSAEVPSGLIATRIVAEVPAHIAERLPGAPQLLPSVPPRIAPSR